MPAESRSAEKQDEFPARVSDALIGAVIGLVLIYVGTRISYWIFRWLVIGIGLLFVGVMSAFVISVAWEKGSPTGRRILSGARGHVRKDPQLGTLIRDVKAEAWVVDVRVGGRTVEFLIDGEKEPNPECVTRAERAGSGFQDLRATVERLSRGNGEGVGVRECGVGCRCQPTAPFVDQAEVGPTYFG